MVNLPEVWHPYRVLEGRTDPSRLLRLRVFDESVETLNTPASGPTIWRLAAGKALRVPGRHLPKGMVLESAYRAGHRPFAMLQVSAKGGES